MTHARAAAGKNINNAAEGKLEAEMDYFMYILVGEEAVL